MTHLVKTLARKNKALVVAQGNLLYSHASLSAYHRGFESLCLENASLTQSLTDCMATSVREVLQYF